MGRILAIDYGQKRVGLAVTDPLKIIASPLDSIHSKDLATFLKEYTSREEVERIIIGLPKNLKNEDTQGTKHVEAFINYYKKHFTIPLETHDERFTSKMAFQAMIDGGLKKKDRQNKGTIDKLSAVIILQSYLQSTGL